MVCEHEYMNMCPPPPNYRASYGPAILSYFFAIRQVLKNMLVAKQRPELSCRRHWGGVLFAIIVPFVILVKIVQVERSFTGMTCTADGSV